MVIEGSIQKNLFIVDVSTGAQLWTTDVGFQIPAPDEMGPNMLPGISAGENTLVVVGGDMIAAYVPSGAGQKH
ncbi:MAG: hypothetical protein ABSD74_17370 [Rhizomicrobium sp.]